MNQVFMNTRCETSFRLTRRLEADAQIDLRQRRRWYDETPPSPTPTPTPAPTPAPQPEKPKDEPPEWVKDPAKAYEEIQKARREAADHRVKAGEAQKKLDEIEAARKAADEKKLVEQNEYQKLYEQEKTAREKAVADAQAATLDALRLKVASEAGLPAGLAERLKGSTEAELKADAETLKAFAPAAPAAPGGPPKQTTTPIPGGPPAGETEAQKRARLFGR